MSRRQWIPSQHGAWAMLITPVLVGALLGSIRVLHALLLVVWLSAYSANFYFALALKSKRWSKFRPQLLAYGGVASVGAIPLLVEEPQLLWIGAVAVPTFLVNVYFVRERNERSWVNDLAGIALAFAVGFGAFRLSDGAAGPAVVDHAWKSLAVVSLYFVGTVLYVKTMIRERGSVGWMRASIGFHVGLALLCALQWWVLAGVALAALLRAIIVPKLGWSPKRIGMLEIVFTVAFGLGVLR